MPPHMRNSYVPYRDSGSGSTTNTTTNTNNNSDSAVNANALPINVWLISKITCQTGLTLAEQVLQRGEKVVLNECPESLKLRELYPETCETVTLDPKIRSLCFSSVAEALKKFGKIDILVTLSGGTVVGAIEETSEALLRDQFNNSFIGTLNMIHAVLPTFCNQKSGHIINVTDVTGQLRMPSLGIWSGACRAIEGYTESLALSLVDYNIKATIVETAVELTIASNPVKFVPTLGSGSYSANNESLAGQAKALYRSLNKFPEQSLDDTITAILSIAGMKDPPSCIPAGMAAINQVREMYSLVSEEIDQYLEESEGS